MDVLGEHCGKQDQYAAAFGNIMHLDISCDGVVTVSHVNLDYDDLRRLENNLMMFYTGFRRNTRDILSHQKSKAEEVVKDQDSIFDYYHRIKEIGSKSVECLESGRLDKFGRLLDEHWQLKRGITENMSNSQIDKWYEVGIENGAIGGKIVGAGGGGFLMLYAEDNHEGLTEVLKDEGLVRMDFKFDFDGSRIVYDGLHF